MEIRFLYAVLTVLVFTTCSPRYYTVKGKFFNSLSFSNEQYFSHENGPQPNDLKKITHDSYGYYTWKTIAYNYAMDNSKQLLPGTTASVDTQHVSIFKTILNEELLSLRNDERVFVQQKGKVLMNNLYFLDDHRCVYISFDDNRFSTDSPVFPLYYDNENYAVRKKDKKLFGQYLRGYYTLSGDTIFIHFHQPLSKTQYFVYGLVKDHAITFTSMTIPNSPNDLYEGGYNAVHVDLKKIFNAINLPVFEWVKPVKDVFYPAQTYLSTGFELYEGGEKNKLHEQLLVKYPSIKISKNLVFREIIYSVKIDEDENEQPVRTYILQDLELNETYEISEFIGLDANSDCAITTW